MFGGSKFNNDAKLGGAVDSLEGREALQRDLDRRESWAITSSMKFNKSKCWILHLGQGSPPYTYKLGDKGERDLGGFGHWQVTYKSTVCPGSQNGPTISWGASTTAQVGD